MIINDTLITLQDLYREGVINEEAKRKRKEENNLKNVIDRLKEQASKGLNYEYFPYEYILIRERVISVGLLVEQVGDVDLPNCIKISFPIQ